MEEAFDDPAPRSISSLAKPMPATKRLLEQWDETTNPLFHAAAGQLRQALRMDHRNDLAER